MEKAKKIKLFLGLIYILIVIAFLLVFFSKFSISDFSSYEIIKKNTYQLYIFKNSNLILLIISYILFTVIWVLLLGFGTPIFLIGGFLFGKWLGTLVVTFSLTAGATLLYILANYMFKELIIDKFSKKFSNLKNKFKNNEFNFMLIYRFVGGIPFFISNILPCLFEVKIKNYFFATFIGMMPQLFVGTSLGSSIEKIIINNDKMPNFFDILLNKDIYYPLLGFILLIIISIFLRKKIYK
tara:strand:- start:289 stop:1005 length:717 start_codon:yes stop_codon:yes gene_type:complete